MELDELKSTWHLLDRQLARQAALSERLFTDAKLERARLGLRPLRWGQILQVLFGATLALWAGSFWVEHRDSPYLLLAGLVVHLYGVLNIVFGALMLSRMARIDYAAPVLEIQKELAHLGRRYMRENVGLGLGWWFLWMPLMMMVFADVFGADLYANAPSVIYGGMATGVAGLLLTMLFARWAFDPGRPQRAARVRGYLAGSSLLRAQRQLEGIARFEAEGAA